MDSFEGKYTLETFAERHNLTRQSALNLISKLKRQGFVTTSGGGRQKRIYTITKTPRRNPNGFFCLLNRYSPEKIYPPFEHHVYGVYSIENAIVDGLKIQAKHNDIRTRNAMIYLFKHVRNWGNLFRLAKKKGVVEDLYGLYGEARMKVKCRRMPDRYANRHRGR